MLKENINGLKNNIDMGKSLVKKVDLPVSINKKNDPIKEATGKKAQSSFVTSLVSRIGNNSINSDYTCYIELDNYACWIIADGIDDIKGAEEASKRIADFIISKFMEKPKFSKRYIRFLLREAHIEIKKIQKTKKSKLGIGTSITILLSDYSSIIFGSLGNTRGILLRDELIYKKTKDHNIAYLMYENKSLDYDSIRFNNQKDKLTQYIGTYGNIRPFISNKIKLLEGDKILLQSSGAWENLDESDIEISLSQSSRVGKWIGSLEKIIQNTQNKKINNYSLIGIFIDKVSINKKDFRMIGSKFIVAIPLLIVFGGLTYKGYKVKEERNLIYKDIYNIERKAKDYFEGMDYYKALEEYKKTESKYKELYILPSSGIFKNKIFSPDILNRNTDSQIENLNRKISNLNLILDLEKMNTTGNINFKENKFNNAISNYEEVKILLNKITILDTDKKEKWINQIEERIIASQGLTVGMELKNSADIFVKENEIDSAIRNYLEAKIIFLKYNKIDLLADATNKVEILTKKREREYKQALSFEKKALKIETSNINESIAYYELSRNIYSDLGDYDKEDELGNKISYLKELKGLLKIEKNTFLKDARVYSNEGEYERALDTVKKAQNNSNILKDTQGIVDSIENEGDILFDNEKYTLAKKNYRKAYNTSIETNNTLQTKELEKKQIITSILIRGDILEKQGDNLFKEKKFKEAKIKYIDAEKEYIKLQSKELYSNEKYDKLIDKINKKEKLAWKESNWIPFF